MDTEQLLISQRGGEAKGAEIWFQCVQAERHKNGDRHHSGRFNVQKRTAFCDVCKYSAGEKQLNADLGNSQPAAASSSAALKEVATYDYKDERGNLLFQVVRYHPKTFRQRRPDGQGGWNYTLGTTRKVLYRLPQVLAAQTVLVVEGEKDVAAAEGMGFTATCNSGGAGKWKDEYGRQLAGKTVLVVPDADEPGQKHADEVVANVSQYARLVLPLPLPDGKKDLSEWVAQFPDAQEAAAVFNDMVDSLLGDTLKSLGLQTMEEAATQAAAEVAQLKEHGYDLQFGIKELDDRLGGIMRRRVYVVGGRTSHGKTGTMMNIIRPNVKAGKRVLYLASENPDEIAPRQAALEADVPLDNFTKPHKISPDEYTMVQRALEQVKQLGPLVITRPPSLAKIKQAVAAFKPDIVVLDYLQRWVMIQGGGSAGNKSEEHRLGFGKAMSACTDIAQDNNCAVFVLSQMARRQRPMGGHQQKADPSPDDELADEPTIGDLKESGDIENFADNILLIYWRHKDVPSAPATKYKIIIGKAKLGDTGRCSMVIDPSTNRIT